MKNEMITPAAITTVTREWTKDPEYCVRHLFHHMAQLLPNEAEFYEASQTTWEHQVALRSQQLIGDTSPAENSYWINAINVCEDSAAGHIPKPSTPKEMLAAMVLDYRSNVQGMIHGPHSAGKVFRSGSVDTAARHLLRNMGFGF